MKVAESPDFLQSVMDDDRVWRWIAPDDCERLPLSAIFADGIGLEFDGGGFFFHRLGDGVYEVHTLFLPGSRHAFQSCQAAAHFMFCATDCLRIVTKVPADNVAAWRLTEKMQFHATNVRENAFKRGGEWHDVKHYALDLDDWMRRQVSPEWVGQQMTQWGQHGKGARALYRWAVMYDDYSVFGEMTCP